MVSKGFLVKVELDIQKVSCPGVWLCSNGKVSLELKMLDSSVQTRTSKPTFPISIYEKYMFSKIFHNDKRLNELQKSLNNEWFYVELVHWKSREDGCILATFQTTLDDLLYPTTFRGVRAGKETDLLMVPTSLFPGSIVPKLEIRTKTTIEEILTDAGSTDTKAQLLTRSTMESLQRGRCSKKSPSRRVCHSVTYSRAQKPINNNGNKKEKPPKRPPFVYRKVPEDFLLRKSNNWCFIDQEEDSQTRKNTTLPKRGQCYCNNSKSQNKPTAIRRTPNLSNEHPSRCSICTAYDGYFLPLCNKAKYFVNNNCNLEKLCGYCRQTCSGGGMMDSSNDRCSCCSSPCSCDDTTSPPLALEHGYETPYEEKSDLTRKLHERLRRVLHSKCIDCKDVW